MTIPAFLKEGAIVRCSAPIGVMRVTHVDDSGVSARRATSTRNDAFQQLHDCFQPASIEDRIRFVIVEARIESPRTVIPHNKDERQFDLRFADRLPTGTIEELKALFDKVDSSENPAFGVTVPQSWLDDLVLTGPVTPALLAQAQAQGEAEGAMETAKTWMAERLDEVTASPLVVEWITRLLTNAGQDMTGAQIFPSKRLGKNVGDTPTYAIVFGKTGQISLSQLDLARLGFVEPVRNGVKIIIDLPDDWGTEEAGDGTEYVTGEDLGAPEYDPDQAEKKHLLSDAYGSDDNSLPPDEVEPAPADPELTETARLIDELRERNARLQVQLDASNELADARQEMIDSLIGEINGAAERAADALEAVTEPAGLATTRCVKIEFITFSTNQGERIRDLEAKINSGWRIAYERIEDGGKTYNARLEYSDLTPAAPIGTSARIASTAEYVAFPAKGTPPRRYEEIANDRATLNRMVDDMEVSHSEFVLAVRKSRLPRDEQDTLVAQNFKAHAKADTAAKLAAIPNFKFDRNPFQLAPVEVKS